MNDENNVEMFTTSVRGGKAFAAEQKLGNSKQGSQKSWLKNLK